MVWNICFFASVLCLILCTVFAVLQGKLRKKRGFLEPFKLIFLGVIVSALILFTPLCLHVYLSEDMGIAETLLITVHSVIRLFVVDGDFEFVLENVLVQSEWLYRGYISVFALLFVAAPLLTFGLVLSFFNNISAYLRYMLSFFSPQYIFSVLNEKSLALAESIHDSRGAKIRIVFTNVRQGSSDALDDYIKKAKKLGAICFEKDITSIDFSFHAKNKALNFFVFGEDRSENVVDGLKLIRTFRYRDHTNLYVFSTEESAGVLLSHAFHTETADEKKPIKIKLRRVNEVRALINRTLYEDGYETIFSSAYPQPNGEKQITALIIGMGLHGTEMTKALSWFCQMDGYRVHMHCFDTNEDAESRFTSLCPELMDSRYNGRFDIEGEAAYKIKIHSGVDVMTAKFDAICASIAHPTYVFVALGDDEKNISAALKLRTLLLKNGAFPKIQSIVYSTPKKEALYGITNFKRQEYDIDFIGDIQTCFSEKVILHSDIEAEALRRHIKWGTESDFWRYDYNYKSSIASAIHRKMKRLCGITAVDKAPQDRTENELQQLRILEHCRWNAYMRSEGYTYGGTIEKEGRNDLAKMHNCLVPFADLPLAEQIKDDD